MRSVGAAGPAALCVMVLVLALATAPADASGGRGSTRSSVVTVEGTVRSVSVLPAEGELPVVAISIVDDDATDGEAITVLLGPVQAMEEIGFAVKEGDRCRARVFRSEGGAARAQKVLNVSRGTMVRLRTLHQIPLWNGRGSWQGGPCRSGQGSGGGGKQHHHGGR